MIYSDTNQMTWALGVTCRLAFRDGEYHHNTHLPLEVPTSDDDHWAQCGNFNSLPSLTLGTGVSLVVVPQLLQTPLQSSTNLLPCLLAGPLPLHMTS